MPEIGASTYSLRFWMLGCAAVYLARWSRKTKCQAHDGLYIANVYKTPAYAWRLLPGYGYKVAQCGIG